LLERAKFLAIFASNLDEFFMVRVAGLKRRDETGLSVRSADGLSPREQLALIARRTQELADKHAHVFLDSVRPALAAEGISIVRWADLSADDHGRLSAHFHEQVFPVLTPLAVDHAHPFPYISGLSLNLAVTVKDSVTRGEHFARVKVPDNVGRFVRVKSTTSSSTIDSFLPMEELISAHLDVLFPGMEIVEHHAFLVHGRDPGRRQRHQPDNEISRNGRNACLTCRETDGVGWPASTCAAYQGASAPRAVRICCCSPLP